MNERIEKLIEQCTVQNFSDCTGGFETFDKEKFAELIVRECIAICQHNSDDDDDQFDLGRVYQAKEITQLIKTHFGVEE